MNSKNDKAAGRARLRPARSVARRELTDRARQRITVPLIDRQARRPSATPAFRVDPKDGRID